MKSALVALQAGIADLRWFIESLRIEWELLASATASPPCSQGDEMAARLRQHVEGNHVAKRRYDYNSLIVSLYGVLEQYIEALMCTYASSLNAVVPRYADMPDAVRNSHINLTFDLISKCEQSRYRGVVTPQALVENLHSCLSNQAVYRVNSDAFCLHTANFRADVVDQLFGRVGIKGISQRLHLFSPLTECLQALYLGANLASLNPENKYFHLNDLAERRNEVAHGRVSNLLSIDIIYDYVNFIESYCMALYELVRCDFLEYVTRHTATALGQAIAVYNNTIVCLELRDVAVSVGDILIAMTSSDERPYLAGEICEMQVDRKPIESVHAAGPVKVGIRVDFKCKNKFGYFYIKKSENIISTI